MKWQILITCITLSQGLPPLFTQTMQDIADTKLYLVTDVKSISTASDGSSDPGKSTGVGKLGVSFKSEYFYGSVLFNVTSRNKEITTTDSSETKVFANNLLTPDNSGQGLSNFRISLGMKSFYPYDEDWSNVPLFSWKRLGAYGYWQVNNTSWTKTSTSTSIYISSIGIYATYSILSLELLGEDKEKVYISWFGGFENRILGGDYSLRRIARSVTAFWAQKS